MCGFFSIASVFGRTRTAGRRRASIALGGLLLATTVAWNAAGTAAPPAATETLVLHGATVIDGTGAPPRPAADVVVRDGRIVAVGGACDHPAGARVLDVGGRYVLPGFVDMHAHLLEHGRNEKGEIPPRVDWPLVRRSLELLVEHGVTTVRDPGSETEAAVTLRRMLAERRLRGPRSRTAGRIVNASGFDPEPFQPVATADDVRREIRWQHAAGIDFVKLYSAMTPDLVAVAVEEAHALGLPVIGHLQRTSWLEAARLGVDQLAHGAPWTLDLLPPAVRAGYPQTLFGRVYWLDHVEPGGVEVQGTLAELARRRIVVDPTLIAYHTKFFGNDRRWLDNPDNALLPPRLVAGWKAGSFTRDWTPEQYAAAQRVWPKMLALTRAMHDAGVRLVVGTDMPTPWIVAGASFHDELAFLRDAGIPAAAILRMATAEGAAALGLADEVGAVRPGLVADLVVLAADPLARIENTRSIVAVLQAGEVVHDPGELHDR